MTEPADPDLERLIEFIRRDRGFDFSGYKRPTLGRRVRKRMADVGVESLTDYVDQLQASPDEFAGLFDTILINVSSFFRDPPVWEHVAREVIPAVLATKGPGTPIRAWSAGCASGEEPYTIAMLLAEALGESEFRQRVKIFATDVDEDTLREARQAVYSAERLADVPVGLRERWFTEEDGMFRLDAELRRSVVFGHNDLLHDAPISRLDLAVCRNTLIYFNAEAQGDVIRRFQLALNDGAFIVLGKSELMLADGNTFTPHEPSLRISRKVPGSVPGRRVTSLQPAAAAPPGIGLAGVLCAIESGPVAQLVLDPAGRVALASAALRRLVALTEEDVGRPLKDLEISYHPVDLRSLLVRATASGESVRVPEPVAWQAADGVSYLLDIELTPLRDAQGAGIGTSVTFLDTTRGAQLTAELEDARHEADTAFEELQTMVEELETTNEELQSTNEELETTNEELQSTNEELQTTNEELQSTGDEREATNAELEARTAELNRLNARMNAMFQSVGVAAAVVDRELRIELWNGRAEELWGVDIDDVRGKHLLNLDIGLPLGRLRDPLRQCITEPADGASEGYSTTLPANDCSGNEIVCSVRCIPLPDADGAVEGVIILMQPA